MKHFNICNSISIKMSLSKNIPGPMRREVWRTWMGLVLIKKCYCCHKVDIEADKTTFECGHVISRENNGATSVKNLRPICRECNSRMRTQHMKEFMR